MLSVLLCSCVPDGHSRCAQNPSQLEVENGIQKQKASCTQRSELHTDGESAGIIVIRPVPVFITFPYTGLNAALHSSETAERLLLCDSLLLLWRTGRADQRKMRLTGLDNWTLNLFLPVGRDVISHSRIKKNTHMHTKGALAFFCAIFRGHRMG